mgnify:CR=1 FL=1
MAEEAELEDPKTAKKSKKPLIIGVALALVLGAAGFFAVYTGLILGSNASTSHENHSEAPLEPLPDLAFIPMDPIVINLGRGSANRHLRFRGELEVEPSAKSEVTSLLPRITDVLNGYLRAVKVSELEEPYALIKLRGQMLRRIQIVTGEGRVHDLLVMEFVLN